MKPESNLTRRSFLKLGAGGAMMLGLGRLGSSPALAATSDYKALVCVFLFGGNDGHNLVVPLDPQQYAAYANARGAVGIPQNQLLPITDGAQGNFGLHPSLGELKTLYAKGNLALLANVGMLARPTSYQQFNTPGFALPPNLRSHSDQVVQMQTAIPAAGAGTGWGARTLDWMEYGYGYNATTTFPVSISMKSPALFCAGSIVRNVSLQPGNALDQDAMHLFPAAAAQARAKAQKQIAVVTHGNAIVDSANRVLADAIELQPVLASASSQITFTKKFPTTTLGSQLAEIARIIALSSGAGVGRQVFFCSLGGFDTHAGQSYQQGVLLQELSQALDAFHAATEQVGAADRVTTFTLSDFGRTLQPSGTGSDHGWGSHHLILGGAVQGGRMYGRFPRMTNYANFNATAEDFADARGVMLPSTSLVQYAATLAHWFGAADAELDDLFPTLSTYTTRNLGFVG